MKENRKRKKRLSRWLPGLLLVCCVAAPALAVDGVIEINQARALNGGVTAGDTAGFPVTISAAGSYRLTGNLTVSTDVDVIQITSSNVTLDLNGFTITGLSSGTTSKGITGSGLIRYIEIRNGTVQDCASDGISFSGGYGYRIIGVKLMTNGNHGVAVTSESTVKDCTARANGAHGFSLGSHSVITGSVASSNNENGIILSNGVAANNTADSNTSYGISCGSECTIAGNVTSGNSQVGIDVGARSTVIDNTISSNEEYGLQCGATSVGYARNVIENNGMGTVVSGTEIGTNLCNGNTTCP